MNRFPIVFILVIFICLDQVQAQFVDSIQMSEITISTFKDKQVSRSSFNIRSLSLDSLLYLGHFNLAGMLTRIPGVTILSTGPSISKPVIRGMFGNRVLVLIAGLKFDNQQWQEEHGLGLSDLGLSRIELIKGPLGALYGSEALGGIINIIDESKAKENTKEQDLSVRFHSNTLGVYTQYGIKKNVGGHWWRIRAGVDSHADYSDGNHQRVLNSRFQAYYFKYGYGFQKKNWISENNFSSSFNKAGFIFNDIYDFVKEDGRWNRRLDVNPAHMVLLNTFNSENKWIKHSGNLLKFNIGLQSNRRLENEGSGAISLDMHLLTAQYLLKYEINHEEHSKWILTHLGSFEDNTNYGPRKIIPDARMQEANLSVFNEYWINQDLIWENSLGVGEKWIKTYFTATVNGPEKEVHPFNKFSPYINYLSGITYNPNVNWNLKMNVASGVRIPNLAELSSNGLHEGVFTYEIGNPGLKNERSVAFNAGISFTDAHWSFSCTPFLNLYADYVYLAPTKEEWFGFPVYRFKQQNAKQVGAEIQFKYSTKNHFYAGVEYSGMNSKTADGQYTPFIPAHKVSPKLEKTFKDREHHYLHAYIDADIYSDQHRVYTNEKTTPAYTLINVGISGSFQKRNREYNLGLTCNNLTNTAYYDHLSRFKNYGILNMGRNISVSLKVKWIDHIKSKNE